MEKFEQHVNKLGALGGAIDGVPVKRKRGERKANPNSGVTTNVVCYCGSRFDDLVDFSTHVRGDCPELVRLCKLRKANGHRLVAECGTNSGVARHRRSREPLCGPCSDADRKRRREWRANPENRKREQQRTRERQIADPEVLERQRESTRRWRSDPEVLERVRARAREYARERRSSTEGRAKVNDAKRAWRSDPHVRERIRAQRSTPEYRDRENERRRARKKAEREAVRDDQQAV